MEDYMSTDILEDAVVVRNLTPADFDAVVSIDAKSIGRRREEFYRMKLRQALAETGIWMSLAAEIDRALVGFLLARVFYGEFGQTEPVAMLDALAVHPDFRQRRVGSTLVEQLRTNLLGLGIATLQTEVDWDSPDLLAFFHAEGFRPAPRFVLNLDLAHTRE
jgi:predicted N-acetyltransferase YhbS